MARARCARTTRFAAFGTWRYAAPTDTLAAISRCVRANRATNWCCTGVVQNDDAADDDVDDADHGTAHGENGGAGEKQAGAGILYQEHLLRGQEKHAQATHQADAAQDPAAAGGASPLPCG